jgi:hypothetical protein
VHVIADATLAEAALAAALAGLDARIARPRLTMEDQFVGRVLGGAA